MSESRGKRREEEHEHEEHGNHEAWVIPYADLLTLLMALFLVLWAVGSDDEKLEAAAESFRRELSPTAGFDIGLGNEAEGGALGGGVSVLDGAGPSPVRSDQPTVGNEGSVTGADQSAIAPQPVPISPTEEEMVGDVRPETFDILDDSEDSENGEGTGEEFGDPLTEVERAVREQAEGTGLLDVIGFRREERGLIVTIVTDQVLFEPGRAEVQPRGLQILEVVADALVGIPNQVSIEGHTDARPISTTRYPSNWELSTARATSVLRYLVEERGFDATRLSAAGYAATRPVDAGAGEEALARNRRVEIVVLSTA